MRRRMMTYCDVIVYDAHIQPLWRHQRQRITSGSQLLGVFQREYLRHKLANTPLQQDKYPITNIIKRIHLKTTTHSTHIQIRMHTRETSTQHSYIYTRAPIHARTQHEHTHIFIPQQQCDDRALTYRMKQ